VCTTKDLATSVSALTKFQTEVETEKQVKLKEKEDMMDEMSRKTNKKLTVVGMIVAFISSALGYIIHLIIGK